MNRKLIVTMIVAALLSPIVTMQCARDDMAVVRIQIYNMPRNTSHNGNSLIDRLFGFFMPAAYAGSPWMLPPQIVQVVISAPDLSDIVFDLPPTESSFVLEVPAGPARRITVYGIETTYGFGKEWGGHAEVDLNPGDERDVQINMLPMVKFNSINEDGPIFMSWNALQSDYNGLVQGYNIYRSESPDDNYVNIESIPGLQASGTSDANFTQCTTYYYKINVSSTLGEGELSDYYQYTTFCP